MSRIVDSYGRPKFDLDEFDRSLNLLADKMEERNIEPFDIYAIGGYICLLNGKREFTHDIDAYYNGNDDLLKAIAEVGREVRNPEWLNNAVDSHRAFDISTEVPSLDELLSINDSFEFERNIRGRINIFCASAFTVIFMKLIAFRDTREDKTDLKDICDLASDYSVDEVIKSLQKFKPLCRISSCFEDYISNLLFALYMNHQINDEEYINYIQYIQ